LDQHLPCCTQWTQYMRQEEAKWPSWSCEENCCVLLSSVQHRVRQYIRYHRISHHFQPKKGTAREWHLSLFHFVLSCVCCVGWCDGWCWSGRVVPSPGPIDLLLGSRNLHRDSLHRKQQANHCFVLCHAHNLITNPSEFRIRFLGCFLISYMYRGVPLLRKGQSQERGLFGSFQC
jgi:hypothetical protein